MFNWNRLISLRGLIFLAVTVFLSSNSESAVIFQDNFNNPTPSAWTSNNAAYPPWNENPNPDSYTCSGITKQAGSIEAPGRGGTGNSFRLNRCNGFPPQDFAGYMGWTHTGSPYYADLYVRMYIKAPPEWNWSPGGNNYLKWDRWLINNTASTAYPTSIIYFDWLTTSDGAHSDLNIYPMLLSGHFSRQPLNTWYATNVRLADIADGSWHCIEFHINLTGIMDVWLDGVLKMHVSENWGPGTDTRIVRVLSPGIGNMNLNMPAPSGYWNFPTNNWYALEADDYVLSTTYVGPDGSTGDTSPPTVPTNLAATSVTGTSATLSWSPSTDTVGVSGYRIYRGGIQVGTAAAASFVDSGLAPSTSYAYTVAAYDAAGNVSAQSNALTVTTPASADVTPPQRSAGAPSGTLSAGTAQASLSLTTNENATCRYSTTAGTSYASMTNVFSTTGGISQSTPITGLADGASYNYYVRCRDTSGNTNPDDYPISFSVATGTQTILLQENFVDTGFTSRGWYDAPAGTISTVEHPASSSTSFECRFLAGAQGCSGGAPSRHAFTETDSLYVSYYVKHSATWVGSGVSYHPHLFYILTNADPAYSSLAWNHLTTYLEENSGRPRIALQDGANVNTGSIGVDLTATTENRAVAGCNGDSDGNGLGTCYQQGTYWMNGKTFDGNQVYFSDTTGSLYKGDWHFVEMYVKLNSVAGGKGVADGILRSWVDGTLAIDRSNVMLRTGQNPTMKFNQLIVGPYIGDGSPLDQTIWFANLTVATSRPGSPPGPGTKFPVPPSNLTIR